jgi:hypothetical protein
LFVGEVPKRREDSVLEEGGVGTFMKESFVVIKLQEEAIEILQLRGEGWVEWVSQIGDDADPQSTCLNEEGHRLRSVVWEWEGFDPKLPNVKEVPRRKFPRVLKQLGFLGWHACGGGIKRDAQPSAEEAGSPGVVFVPVSKEDCVKIFGAVSDQTKAFDDSLFGEPCVNQDGTLFALDQGAVALATRSEGLEDEAHVDRVVVSSPASSSAEDFRPFHQRRRMRRLAREKEESQRPLRKGPGS